MSFCHGQNLECFAAVRLPRSAGWACVWIGEPRSEGFTLTFSFSCTSIARKGRERRHREHHHRQHCHHERCLYPNVVFTHIVFGPVSSTNQLQSLQTLLPLTNACELASKTAPSSVVYRQRKQWSSRLESSASPMQLASKNRKRVLYKSYPNGAVFCCR